MNNLASIRIVLVNSTHPGNIGAAARAMKNMGLTRLYLVNPRQFPSTDATVRAAGADDLLANAVVTSTLKEAVQDCELVVGTSARARSLSWPTLSLSECAKQVVSEAKQREVAIVFGAERTGLPNSELKYCHYLLYIDCNPEFSSLNLAAAVQIVAYEIRSALIQMSETVAPSEEISEYATAEEMAGFYGHLQQTLQDMDFFKSTHSRQLMQRLHRLFNRARLEKTELNILRGILTSMQTKIPK